VNAEDECQKCDWEGYRRKIKRTNEEKGKKKKGEVSVCQANHRFWYKTLRPGGGPRLEKRCDAGDPEDAETGGYKLLPMAITNPLRPGTPPDNSRIGQGGCKTGGDT